MRRCTIEFFNQSLYLGHACRIGSANDQGVAARLGHDAALEAPIGRCARLSRNATGFEQAQYQGCQVYRNGIFQFNHFNIGCISHIQRGNDARNTPQVIRVIRDHQRVIQGVGIDSVVGADERTQNRYQIVRRLKIELENLRRNLPAEGTAWRTIAGFDRRALQFGIGFGDYFEQAGRLDHGETLHAQTGQKLGHGHLGADRFFADQGHLTLDAWINHYVHP